MKKTMSEIVVIGGGAAGMLLAGLCASHGKSVVLIEKNDRLGKKLRITGKGRCNITNNCSVREVIENIPTGGRFLYSAVTGFTPQDAVNFFEGIGVPLKTERGARVFPVSDKAEDVVAALAKYAAKSGVSVKTAKALEIVCGSGGGEAVITDSGIIPCQNVCICTGGKSYPLTGSTGDGYELAKKLGHKIIAPKPSLVPLEIRGGECALMAGLSLRNVKLSVYAEGKKPIYEDFGEMLFTHFGVSGPLILSASSHMRDFDKKKYRLEVDLKPALDDQKLDARLLRDFEKYANKDFSNALDDLAAKSMVPVIVKRSGINPEKKVHSITKEERRRLLELFKHFELEVSAPRPISEAIVTSGGVDTIEIDPKTMQSKLVSGLYFAGEVINADAYTGGFNLQIAWSTAYAAAKNICGGEI